MRESSGAGVASPAGLMIATRGSDFDSACIILHRNPYIRDNHKLDLETFSSTKTATGYRVCTGCH
jgi:hypothetical protein